MCIQLLDQTEVDIAIGFLQKRVRESVSLYCISVRQASNVHNFFSVFLFLQRLFSIFIAVCFKLNE